MRLIAYPSARKVIQETTVSNLQLIASKKVSRVKDWLNNLKTDAERIANNQVAASINLTKQTLQTFLNSFSYTGSLCFTDL